MKIIKRGRVIQNWHGPIVDPEIIWCIVDPERGVFYNTAETYQAAKKEYLNGSIPDPLRDEYFKFVDKRMIYQYPATPDRIWIFEFI